MRVILCNGDDRWQFADLARRRLFFLWNRADIVIWDLCTPPQPDDDLWPGLPRKVHRAGFALALAALIHQTGTQPVALLYYLNPEDAADKVVAIVNGIAAAAKSVGAGNRFCLLLCSARPLPADLVGTLQKLDLRDIVIRLLIVSATPVGVAGVIAPHSAQVDLLGLVTLLTHKGELTQLPSPLPNSVTIQGTLDAEPPWIGDWRRSLEDVARWVDDQRYGLSANEQLNGPLAPLARTVTHFIHWMQQAPAPAELKNDLDETGRWLKKLRVGWWPLLPKRRAIASQAARLWPDLMKIIAAEITKVSISCREHQEQQVRAIRNVETALAASPASIPPSVAAVDALDGLVIRCRQARLTRPDVDLAPEQGAMLRARLRRIVRRMLSATIWWPGPVFVLLCLAAITLIPGFVLAVATAELFIPVSDPLRDILYRLTTVPVALDHHLPLLHALWAFSGTGAVIGAGLFLHRRRQRVLYARDRLITCSAALIDWFRNLLINNSLNLWRRFDRRGIAMVERRLRDHTEDRRHQLELAATYAAPILPLNTDRAGNRLPADLTACPPGRWMMELRTAMNSQINKTTRITVSDRRFPGQRPIPLTMPAREADIEIRNT